MDVFELFGKNLCLGDAFVVEGDVDAALDLHLEIPIRFPVASVIEFSHGHYYSTERLFRGE